MVGYETVRPLLFKLPPETAHDAGIGALRVLQSTPLRRIARARYRYRSPSLRVEAFDTTFPTPVGVAAGFDKNAAVSRALDGLGFGFVEAGTVTPEPQSGNPRPRLFRVPEERSLINRLAFNSEGAERVRARLETAGGPDIPLGINVGKMNDSSAAEAVADYRRVVDRLRGYADYFVVNVSCPNTPDEFDEERPEHLAAVLSALETVTGDTPLCVKVGPDSDREALRDLLAVLESFDVDGIVATNTTTDRDALSASPNEPGGISGPPLEDKATEVVRTLYARTDVPIIGVGGVSDADSAYRRIRAGATLVQLYTGFVYGGPATARRISEGLVDRLERDGFESIDEAVGVDA